MAINPLVKQLATKVRNAIYGSEVRESIAESMEVTNELTENTKTRQDNLDGQFQSVIDNTTGKDVVSAPEILASRVGEDGTSHANLKARLDDEQSRVNTQLAQISTNVKLFGAVGDGVTDDVEPIQQSINKLTNGGTVFFPEGVYIISKRLILKDNVTLDGSNATIKLKANRPIQTDGVTEWDNNTLFHLENLKNISFNNLVLDGNETEQLPSTSAIFNGIIIKNCENIHVEKCTLKDMQHVGIRVVAKDTTTTANYTSKGVWGLSVLDCSFSGMQQAMQITESFSKNIYFKDNIVENTYSHGLSTYPGVSDINIIGNKIKNTGLNESMNGAGIRLFETVRAFVSSNTIENTRIHGIYVNTSSPALFKKSSNIIISNNIVQGGIRKGANGDGIACNGDDITIVDNHIKDYSNLSISAGVRHAGFSSNIKGNTISECKTGISANGKSLVISDNTCVECVTYGIVLGNSDPTSGSVSGNVITGLDINTNIGIRINTNAENISLNKNVFEGVSKNISNIGISTKGISSYGEAEIPINDKAVFVFHNLAEIPSNIIVTPKGQVDGVWVSNITASSFNINVGTNVTTATKFSWRAEV